LAPDLVGQGDWTMLRARRPMVLWRNPVFDDGDVFPRFIAYRQMWISLITVRPWRFSSTVLKKHPA
jgi:hypothetical protein